MPTVTRGNGGRCGAAAFAAATGRTGGAVTGTIGPDLMSCRPRASCHERQFGPGGPGLVNFFGPAQSRPHSNSFTTPPPQPPLLPPPTPPPPPPPPPPPCPACQLPAAACPGASLAMSPPSCTVCATPFAVGAVPYPEVAEEPAEVWTPPGYPVDASIGDGDGIPLTWARVQMAHNWLVEHATCAAGGGQRLGGGVCPRNW